MNSSLLPRSGNKKQEYFPRLRRGKYIWAVCAARIRIKQILSAIFVIFISIAASQGAQAAEAPAHKPRVVVENVRVEDGGLTAGEVCEVRVTLRNMSASIEVESVLVTGRWSNDTTPPVDFEKTNQAYISGIKPEQTGELVFSLESKPVYIMALDTVLLYLDIAYSYDQSPDNLNTALVRLPVKKGQPDSPVIIEPYDPTAIEQWFDLPFPGDPRMLYASGSALCAFAAAIHMLYRHKRR